MASELITTEYARQYLQKTAGDLTVPAFRIYRTSAGGCTAATVQVTATSLVTTETISGVTTYTDSLTASANDTLGELVAVVNARSGWVATLDANSSASSSDLVIFASTSCYGSSAEQQINVIDHYLIHELIRGVSDQIEAICQRVFASTAYTSWLDGTGDDLLYVPNPPIVAVNRVSTSTLNGLNVSNSGGTLTMATVGVTSTAVVLRHYSSAGALTTNTLTFATYPTLTLMAAAITACGNGWSGSVALNSLTNERTTLLRPSGHRNALAATVALEVADTPVADFALQTNAGGIVLPAGAEFPYGSENIYVEYTGGYSTVPYPIQMLAAELVAEAYNVALTGHGLTQGQLDSMRFVRESAVLAVHRPEVIKRLQPWIIAKC